MDNLTNLLVEQIIEKTKEKIKEGLRIKSDVIKNMEQKFPQWYQETKNQIKKFRPDYKIHLPETYSDFRKYCDIRFGFQMKSKSIRNRLGYDTLGKFVHNTDGTGRIELNTQYLILNEEKWKSVFIHELVHFFEYHLNDRQKVNFIKDEELKEEIMSKFKNTHWSSMEKYGYTFNQSGGHSELWIELQGMVDQYFGKKLVDTTGDIPTQEDKQLIQQGFKGRIYLVQWKNKKNNKIGVQFVKDKDQVRTTISTIIDLNHLNEGNGIQIKVIDDQNQIYDFEQYGLKYNGKSTSSLTYYNLKKLLMSFHEDKIKGYTYLASLDSQLEMMMKGFKNTYDDQVYLEYKNGGLKLKYKSNINELNELQRQLENYFAKSKEIDLDRIVFTFGVVVLLDDNIKYTYFVWDTKIPTNFEDYQKNQELYKEIERKTKELQNNKGGTPLRIESILLDKKIILQLKEIFDKHNIESRKVISFDTLGSDQDTIKKMWNRRIQSVMKKNKKYGDLFTIERKKYSDGNQTFTRIK